MSAVILYVKQKRASATIHLILRSDPSFCFQLYVLESCIAEPCPISQRWKFQHATRSLSICRL